ncbi:hypothetical protein Tco_0958080 [Tanacetum coccineum]
MLDEWRWGGKGLGRWNGIIETTDSYPHTTGGDPGTWSCVPHPSHLGTAVMTLEGQVMAGLGLKETDEAL